MKLVPMAEYHGLPCPYCDRPMIIGVRPPTRDHVRPKRAGADFNHGNKLIVCRQCNNDKSDMTLVGFVEWLEKRNDKRAEIVRRIPPDTGLPK